MIVPFDKIWKPFQPPSRSDVPKELDWMMERGGNLFKNAQNKIKQISNKCQIYNINEKNLTVFS